MSGSMICVRVAFLAQVQRMRLLHEQVGVEREEEVYKLIKRRRREVYKLTKRRRRRRRERERERDRTVNPQFPCNAAFTHALFSVSVEKLRRWAGVRKACGLLVSVPWIQSFFSRFVALQRSAPSLRLKLSARRCRRNIRRGWGEVGRFHFGGR